MFTPILFSHPGFIASRRYPLASTQASAGAVGAVDMIYLFPIILRAPISIVSLSAYVATGGAGSAMKAAIWADSPVSHRPLGAPLAVDNTGIATTSSTTAVTLTTGAVTLAPGYYWGGTKFTGTLPSMRAIPNTDVSMAHFFGSGTGGETQPYYQYAHSYATAMPTFAEGDVTAVTVQPVPMLWAVT